MALFSYAGLSGEFALGRLTGTGLSLIHILLFMTTNELPQLMVARIMRGVANRASARSLFCSCTVAPLLWL